MFIEHSEFSEHFVDIFKNKIGLTDEEFSHLIIHFHKEYIPQKFYFFKAGDICRRIAYINKGTTRTFTIDEKGREHILYFSFEDWLIGDQESLFTQEPGLWNIQAVEDCELFYISKTDMDTLEDEISLVVQVIVAPVVAGVAVIDERIGAFMSPVVKLHAVVELIPA